jgi:hypothetical protein
MGNLSIPLRIAHWKGTDRYHVRRCIGTGSMGAVYEAFDRERGRTIALKRLRHFSGSALYLFKQEFRTLADVHHPNLVRLHELVATEANDFFFTMELVRGVDLLEYVRGRGVLDVDRLRTVLRQLAEGVHALHDAGKLHRDIKPSNVLVTTEGRVVLLDFGVATEVSHLVDENLSDERSIVGTALYMSPEQAIGAAPTPASDWYGVGGILFEALVGGAPFVGSVAEVLKMKAAVDAPLPSDSVKNASVPADLDALCGELLQRSPDRRPTGTEILRRLGVSTSEGGRALRASLSDPTAVVRLVGRESHIRSLRDAFEATRVGRCVTVRVGGPSGMGKSALVQEFLDDLVRRGEAVVLRGRAYERESVPYKAIDSWVDALSRHLLRLSDQDAQITLAKDIWALARLFPVLLRVPEIADVREQMVFDPHRMRRRAFAALRELLASLARRQPVVVYVDDAHWGDADSAALLLDLVRPPLAPPLLLVMTYRDDEAQTSPLLIEMRAHWPEDAEERDLMVGPLEEEETRRIALALLGPADDKSEATARAVARESHGNPFLVEELVRGHQSIPPGDAYVGTITLEQSVGMRMARLTGGRRRLLEMVAVSGRPLALSIALAAAGLDGGAEDALALAGARRFVRAGLRDGREVVEVSHERIRDAILGRLSADVVRSHHERLARALEATPEADPEAVAVHLIGAGEKARAAPFAECAAAQAIDKLAFDRAVQLLRMAIEGTPPRSREASDLRARLAEALAWAGRGVEASCAYLDAAEGAPGLRRVELERAAAEQLLTCGRIDEGAEVLHRVLAAMGLAAPRSTLSVLFWLVVYRVWLACVGLRFKERRPEDVRPEDRLRIDAMYAVAMGFAMVDVLLGACMQARHLILALRAGDRFQVLRAATLEMGQLASRGGSETKRERAVREMAKSLAARIASAEAEALFDSGLGAELFLRGHWKQARQAHDRSQAKRAHRHTPWQSHGNLFGVNALNLLGNIKELERRLTRTCVDARERGDLYTTVNLASTSTITSYLVADDPVGARRQLREAMAQWSQKRFFAQHWQAMAFDPDIDLYVGDGARAYDRLMQDLPALKRSLLLTVQFVRAITVYTRGRCAVASIEARPTQRRARIAEARRMTRRLERENMPWTAPLASIVEAAVENAAGSRATAIGALRAAIESAEAANMSMHATAARHRLGELLGGSDGEKLVETALGALGAQGIRNPQRWLAIYLPGSWVGPG